MGPLKFIFKINKEKKKSILIHHPPNKTVTGKQTNTVSVYVHYPAKESELVSKGFRYMV